MSKWLKSTTQKQWVVGGKIIPPAITAKGKAQYLVVSDTEYDKIAKVAAINSLIKTGGIRVYNRNPTTGRNPAMTSVQKLAEANLKVSQLQEQLKTQKKKAETATVLSSNAAANLKTFRKSAIAEIEQRDAQIKELQEQITQLKEKDNINEQVVEEQHSEGVENTGESDPSIEHS